MCSDPNDWEKSFESLEVEKLNETIKRREKDEMILQESFKESQRGGFGISEAIIHE